MYKIHFYHTSNSCDDMLLINDISSDPFHLRKISQWSLLLNEKKKSKHRSFCKIIHKMSVYCHMDFNIILNVVKLYNI